MSTKRESHRFVTNFGKGRVHCFEGIVIYDGPLQDGTIGEFCYEDGVYSASHRCFVDKSIKISQKDLRNLL